MNLCKILKIVDDRGLSQAQRADSTHDNEKISRASKAEKSFFSSDHAGWQLIRWASRVQNLKSFHLSQPKIFDDQSSSLMV